MSVNAQLLSMHDNMQVNNGLSPNPNPNVLYGALVEGSGFSDGFQDQRNVNATQVQLEYNAGFQSLLAGLAEAPGSWEQCLQVQISHLITCCCIRSAGS